MYLYAKDPYETKRQFLINTFKSSEFKHFTDSKVFTEYFNDLNDIYENIEEYDPNKKRIILIVFGNMNADMFSNKKFNPKVTDIFIGGRNLNISLVFIKILD